MQQQQLPDTLSGLLKAAVDDARSLDRDLYLPNHVEWHCPDDYDHCEICLAGAVIAGRLNVRSYSESSPKEFAYSTAMKLNAIDKMRIGEWRAAYEVLHHHNPPVDPHLLFVELPAPSCPYFTDWDEFDFHLRSLDAIIPRLREIEQRLNLDTPDSPLAKMLRFPSGNGERKAPIKTRQEETCTSTPTYRSTATPPRCPTRWPAFSAPPSTMPARSTERATPRITTSGTVLV